MYSFDSDKSSEIVVTELLIKGGPQLTCLLPGLIPIAGQAAPDIEMRSFDPFLKSANIG